MAIRLDDTDDEILSFNREEEELGGVDNNNPDPTLVFEADTDNSKLRFSYIFIKYLSQFKVLYVPVLNWVLVFVFLSLLYKLIYKYESIYAKSALLTTIMTNTLLYGLSDTLAQSISCLLQMLRQRNVRSRSSSTSFIFLDSYLPSNHRYRDTPDDSFYADYGNTRISARQRQNSISENPSYQQLSKQTDKDIFNFHRLVGFMFWGFFISFFQTGWYWVLNHFYTTEPTFVSALERVLSDQGGDKFTLSEKIRKIYFSTLAANYMVWPWVQLVNFLVMPRRYQVPFSSSIGVIWNCFLSMRNASN